MRRRRKPPTNMTEDIEVVEVGFLCSHCRMPHDLDDMHEGSGLCDGCWDDTHFTCKECDEEFHVDDVSRREDTCRSCYDDNFTTCDDCDRVVRVGGDSHHSVNDRDVCSRCLDNNYFYCEGCSQYCPEYEYGSEGRCVDCEDDDDEDEDGPIYSCEYDVMSVLSPMGTPKDGVYFGVELEVESRGDYRGDLAEEAISILGDDFVLAKHDGSLDDGFEIVTAPADMVTHRARWPKFFEDSLVKRLRSWDGGRCGMHVHISREPLSELTVGKIAVFVNALENRPFIEKIAGRTSETYAKIRHKKIADVRNTDDDDRYQAVNLTNDHTVEIRIFRGTLKQASFFRNLEFCQALVGFCRNHGARELTTDRFVAWVGRTPRVYPALTTWLRERGMVRSPRPKPDTITNRVFAVA